MKKLISVLVVLLALGLLLFLAHDLRTKRSESAGRKSEPEPRVARESGAGNAAKQISLIVPAGASARVARILSELDSTVSRVREASEREQLDQMAETFNQIDEYCDELQGKNESPAPAAKEWGDVSPDRHSKILALVAGLENDAEGMVSILLHDGFAEGEQVTVLQ